MKSDKRLLIAILRDAEQENILNALQEADFPVTRIASSGGIMRQGSSTLLIGVEKDQVDSAVQIIRNHIAPAINPGHKRATVFVIKADRFEQL